MMDNTKEYQESVGKTIEKFLRSEVYKPFGLALLKYDIIFTEHVPLGAPAATDYQRIYINPNDEFFTKCKVPVDFIIAFVLCHEIGHIIFMHDQRIGNRESNLWNYATDFMLNLLLKNIESESKDWETQQRLVSMDILNFKKLICYDEEFEGMIEEEIYERLQQDGNFKKDVQHQSYKKFLDEVGVPSDGVGEDDQITVTKTELEINGTTRKKTFIDFPDVKAPGSQCDSDAKDETETQLAKTMFETNILSKGFESKSFEKFLRRMFNAKVPWQTILQDSILIELQRSCDISYGRPRMIWLANPSLPYLPNYEEEEVLGTLVIIIDESASIQDEDIEKAIDIAQQADSYYKNIYAIKHDTQVHWDKFYEDKLTEDDIDELLVRRHSGGTSHKDAFAKVVEFDKKPDCYVSLVLSVTDMASDIESAQEILPRRIPRIYLQNEGDAYSEDCMTYTNWKKKNDG
jgi:predicted metal-dependent peptidase